MAQFDVYESKSSKRIILLCQIQASYHDHLTSRVMIPMLPEKTVKSEYKEGLTPRIEFNEECYLLMTADLAATSVSQLGKKVGSLDAHYYEISRAVDFLMQGF